jgi:hypothetical protein
LQVALEKTPGPLLDQVTVPVGATAENSVTVALQVVPEPTTMLDSEHVMPTSVTSNVAEAL